MTEIKTLKSNHSIDKQNISFEKISKLWIRVLDFISIVKPSGFENYLDLISFKTHA